MAQARSRKEQKKPRRVGVVVRPDAPDVERRAAVVARWLSRRGIEVLAPLDWAKPPAGVRVLERSELVRRADLIVVLGGDGSLLGIARLAGAVAVPVVGIHHGDFGFLTESDEGDLSATLGAILAGRYTITRRSMLAVTVKRRGREMLPLAGAERRGGPPGQALAHALARRAASTASSSPPTRATASSSRHRPARQPTRFPPAVRWWRRR